MRKQKRKVLEANEWKIGTAQNRRVAKPRSVFTELMQGIESMRQHREGELTLRSYEVADPPPLTAAGAKATKTP